MKECLVCKTEIIKKWPYQQKKARFCSHLCANRNLWERKEFTEEHKQKLSAGRDKYEYTPEVRTKMSEIKKVQFANGVEPWNKGKIGVYTEETRESMGSNRGAYGEESHHWKGGLNPMWIRKVRLAENGGSHTYGDWETLKSQYDWTCPSCRTKEPEITLTKDHIIPVTKGGSDNISNIQPLCGSCNSRKHTKVEYFKVDYNLFDY